MYDKTDLIREFEFEHNRCQSYFELMYKTLQFSFAAIVALLVFALGKENYQGNSIMIFQLILPICIYVFGIMYAYNAYALAVCGERAEILHSHIYASGQNILTGEMGRILKIYVATDRKVTLLSYGVSLGFYLVIPIASCILGLYKNNYVIDLYTILSFVFLIIYHVLMAIVIKAISKKHFRINEIQNEY